MEIDGTQVRMTSTHVNSKLPGIVSSSFVMQHNQVNAAEADISIHLLFLDFGCSVSLVVADKHFCLNFWIIV